MTHLHSDKPFVFDALRDADSIGEKTAGLILMGGQASRLGRIRKQDLCVGGQSLMQRAHSVLAPCCQKVYASTSSALELAETEVLQDHGRGPAEAVALAIQALERDSPHLENLVIMPVDCWNIPSSVNQTLLESLHTRQCDVALGCWGTKAYPINCAIRLPAKKFSRATKNRTDKGRSMWALFDGSKVHQEQFEHVFSKNPFLNINDFNDLLKAQALVHSNKVHES